MGFSFPSDVVSSLALKKSNMEQNRQQIYIYEIIIIISWYKLIHYNIFL